MVAVVLVGGPEAYQSAWSNIAEMEQMLHASVDQVTALRDYEYFKYIERYCEAVRNSGIEDSRTELIERLANHLYRSNRDANGATSHTYTNPAVQEDVHAGSHVRVTDHAQSGDRPSEVTNEYLQSSFDIIQKVYRNDIILIIFRFKELVLKIYH